VFLPGSGITIFALTDPGSWIKTEDPITTKQEKRENLFLTFFSVADPDPGSSAFLTPGTGIRD
jgi:hypothetical protein